MREKPENVALSGDGTAVVILDQTRLPNRTEWLELRTPEEMYEAIAQLKVRGAPAIGICAAFCLYVLAGQIRAKSAAEFLTALREKKEDLNTSRPTAVNLSWALNRMERVAEMYLSGRGILPGEEVPAGMPGRESGDSLTGPAGDFASARPGLLRRLKEEAEEIQREDIRMCRSIAENGLALLKEGDGILTHCNAGPLATSWYGTALGPILLGNERGMRFHVYADETRPLLQGARLTSYELAKAGVDVTLICDNMAAAVMKNGWVQACLVGCDRVAANGDTANKIGTCGAAILAAYYKIPFYVLGPTSTIDLSCRSGEEIPVEQRDPSEIREKFYREPMAPAGVPCYNPAFDVTEHGLITGIVTEQGICRPPYEASLAEAVRKAGRR